MKPFASNPFRLLTAAAAVALFASALHAGTVTTTFSFQQGDVRKDGEVYQNESFDGAAYASAVAGRITDNTATSALSTTATATLGNQFQSGSHNGQQHCGLFSYDLTELGNFIAANTGPYSSVTIQSVSFKLITSGTPSGSAMNLNLFGTDPFNTTGCNWSNYTTGTPWTIPYQSGRTETAYNFTGGPSALTPQLGGTVPSTGASGTPAGTTLTWTSSTNFISALNSALARTDKTLYLTARGSFFNTGDNRVNVHTGSATTLDNRPELLITLDVTTTAAPATWTGATSNSWATAGNWSPGSVPATDAPIIFDSSSTANLSTLLNQDFNVTGVTLSNPSGDVSIGGANTLNLGAGGFDLSAATRDLAVSTPIVLGAVQSWNVAGGRALSLSGAVSGNFALTIAGAGKLSLGVSNILPSGAGAGNLILNGTLDLNGTSQSVNGLSGSGLVDNTAAGSATLTVGTNDAAGTFSGIIQDTGGALALVKNGTGALTLTGANDFSGGFTNNGSGNVTPNNSLAFGTGPVVSNAGTLYATATTTFANSLTLNNSTLRIGGGGGRTITWNGPVTATGTSGLTCDGGTGGITLGSTLDIAGATFNSYANGTTNNIVGNVSGAGGNLNVTLGTLQLSGAGNTYGGTTTIGTGCFLRLDATGTLPASGNVVINGGGLTIRNTAGWTHSGTISGDGAGVINLNTGTNATLAGPISGVASINVNTAGTNATISGAISGAAAVNVQLAGAALTLSGANVYTGATTISAGTLNLGASNTLPDSSNIAMGAGTLNAATFSDTAGTLAVTGASTINLGAGATLAFADSSAVDWTDGTLDLTGTFVSGSSLRFGNTSSGLNPTQLGQITATGFTNFALDTNGYLTASVASSGYDSWKSQITNGQDQRDDDADGDGFTNIEEFLFGTSPISANGSLSTTEKSGTNLVIRWKERTSGATYTLLQSTTLNTNWVTATGATPENDGAVSGDYQPRKATVAIGAGNLFFRVQGVEN